MNKLIFLMLGILILGSLMVSAEDKLAYTPNQTMNIVLKCFDVNSGLCTSSTNCNIDVLYPNMTYFVNSGIMTFNATHFNYTAPATWALGVYRASANCSDAVTSGYATWDFYVGKPSTDVQYTATLIGIIIVFGIAVLMFLGFLFVDKFIFKWTFFLFSLLFLVIDVNIISISMFDEAASSGIRNIFDQLGAASYIMYWFIGGVLLIMWVLTTIATLADKQRMKQAREAGEMTDF